MHTKFTPNEEMGLTQASSFSALFVWYTQYARKLDQQMRSTAKTEFLIKNNYWKGITRQMLFQPAFPFVVGIQKKILQEITQNDNGPPANWKIIASASMAGALTGPYCNAAEVYILRRRVHQEENGYQALKQIWKQSGPSAIWRGTPLMTIRNLQFGGVFTGVNPVLKNYLDQKIDLKISTKTTQFCKALIVNILSAVPSGLLASFLTMPADNIAVRRQTNAVGLDRSRSNLEAMRQIYLERGWKGFFVGTKFRCKQSIREFTAFNCFLSLYTYLLEKHKNQSNG